MRTSLEFAKKYFEEKLNSKECSLCGQHIQQNYRLRIAEVGVETGCNAVEILTKWPQVKELHLIDIWEDEEIYQRMLGNLFPFKDRVRIHRCTSMEAVVNFDNQYLDLVYIDADHSYEFVKADVEAWYIRTRIGGIVAGHDWGKHGVSQAVFETLNRKGWINTDYPKPSRDWWMVKEKE